MRRFANYIRQAFCKHEWVFSEFFFEWETEFRTRNGDKVYMRCNKCGYHQIHWKNK